jgi:hypothetical protein
MNNGECTVTVNYYLWCPSSGVATWGGIGSGQLWKAHAESCTTDFENQRACGVAEQEVQF